MAPRKQSSARRVSYDTSPRPVEPFRAENTFVAFSLESLQARNHASQVERLEGLLDRIQALERIKPADKLEWNPPENEDKITDVDVARCLLVDVLGNREPYDWDEARTWRELYEHTYEVSDKLRSIAQNLDDKLDERDTDVDDHNNEIDGLSADARRLQLDIGL